MAQVGWLGLRVVVCLALFYNISRMNRANSRNGFATMTVPKTCPGVITIVTITTNIITLLLLKSNTRTGE